MPIEIGDPAAVNWETVEALVDTGATYTTLPAPLLHRLGVRAHTRDAFVLADGRQIDCDIGRAWIRVQARTEMTLVVFGEPDAEPLLGAYAMEGLRLAPDPVGRRLVPVPGLLMSLAEPAWKAAGRPWPTDDRQDIPARLFRPGTRPPDDDEP